MEYVKIKDLAKYLTSERIFNIIDISNDTRLYKSTVRNIRYLAHEIRCVDDTNLNEVTQTIDELADDVENLVDEYSELHDEYQRLITIIDELMTHSESKTTNVGLIEEYKKEKLA